DVLVGAELDLLLLRQPLSRIRAEQEVVARLLRALLEDRWRLHRWRSVRPDRHAGRWSVRDALDVVVRPDVRPETDRADDHQQRGQARREGEEEAAQGRVARGGARRELVG